MPVVWREKMSVGNDLIDQDHRYLLCLINSVELALKHDDTEALLPVYLKQLVEYTRFHFEREERIQKKMMYPQIDSHKRAHQEIVEHLEGMQKEVVNYLESKSGTPGVIDLDSELDDSIQDEMMELAREWIIEHILVEDKRMEYYLRKLPKNFS